MTGCDRQRDAPAVLPSRLVSLLGGFNPTGFQIQSRRPLECALSSTRVERLDLVTAAGKPVRAILSGPHAEWRDCPAVLYCHAHGNRYDIGASELIDSRPALLAQPYAQALAQVGVVALSIDLPCFGERQDETESSAAKRHLWTGTTLFGAMLCDLAGALTVLSAIDGVDRMRLSAFGISMGATLAFWLAALDHRIASLAQLCCFSDLATLVSAGSHDLHGSYMTVPGLLTACTTGEIAGLVAPRRQFIGIGLADPLTPAPAAQIAIADVRAAYATAEAAPALEVLVSPDTGHVETIAMRRAVIAHMLAR